jgi:hypothetical protein
MLSIIGRVKGSEAELLRIVTAVRGLDGRDVGWDAGIDDLRKALETVASLRAPRSVSLTPLVSEGTPRRMRNEYGWTQPDGAKMFDDADQPERVEPRR